MTIIQYTKNFTNGIFAGMTYETSYSTPSPECYLPKLREDEATGRLRTDWNGSNEHFITNVRATLVDSAA